MICGFGSWSRFIYFLLYSSLTGRSSSNIVSFCFQEKGTGRVFGQPSNITKFYQLVAVTKRSQTLQFPALGNNATILYTFLNILLHALDNGLTRLSYVPDMSVFFQVYRNFLQLLALITLKKTTSLRWRYAHKHLLRSIWALYGFMWENVSHLGLIWAWWQEYRVA